MGYLPDYLVPIDRSPSYDRQARLFDKLASAQLEEELFLSAITMKAILVNVGEDSERHIYIAELQRRFPGHGLLLFGGADRLINVAIDILFMYD